MHDQIDPKVWELVLTFLIGLLSGVVSITRRMLNKRVVVSKLWIISELAGVVFMTALAMDVYPQIEPSLKSTPMFSWVTQWVFVGVCAHAGGRFIKSLEEKFTKKVKEYL